MHFHLGMQLFWCMPFQFGCTLFIWVCTFHLGMHFLFGHAIFIWVCIWVSKFYLGMQFLFGCALFICVCTWVYRVSGVLGDLGMCFVFAVTVFMQVWTSYVFVNWVWTTL